jgi:hypothetical protein
VPGPFHQWLYVKDGEDGVVELFNGARTAWYLENMQLPGSGRISDVLDFGGCEAYAFVPPCDTDPGYLDFPGSAGNSASVPDAAALDITGDITLIADVALDDWSPSATQLIMGKWQVGGQLSYKLEVSTAGAVVLSWTTAGATAITATSTALLSSLAAGERRALRADLDVTNGANRVATIWTAPTYAGPWTQLGSTITSTITSIFASSSMFQMGLGSGGFFAGKLYYAQVRNGMSNTATPGGTAVLTVDPNVISTPEAMNFNALTGQVVTINRSGVNDTVVGVGPSMWEPLVFTNPASDGAPWYNSRFPESGQFLGFHIEEWTGLDDRHVSRNVERTGRPGGGGTLGVLGAAERVMKLNVVLIGQSERAVEYGYRWLATTLENVCSTCSTDSVFIRRFCPSYGLEDLWNGVVELREVGLVEAPQWETDFGKSETCYVRRMSFTLAAGDPCMYMPGTSETIDSNATVSTCLSALALGAGKQDCRPSCNELPSACRSVFTFEVNPLGAAAPVLTLTNDDDDAVIPLRILCYADPVGVGVSPNPCGLPLLGELYTRPLPPWSTLVWDVAGRRVRYKDHSTGVLDSGWAYIDPNDPPNSRFFALPCGTAHVVIEPATTCLTVDTPNSRYTYGGYEFSFAGLHYPTLALEVQERIGCP